MTLSLIVPHCIVTSLRTVSEMQRLMKEGGHIFWVAPSGGRDRRPNFERRKGSVTDFQLYIKVLAISVA